MKRLIVSITTHNRTGPLRRLLRQIREQERRSDVALSILLYDDATEGEAEMERIVKTYFRAKDVWFRFEERQGKQGFWRVWNRMLSDLKSRHFDLWFALQDDFVLDDHFFHKAIKTWRALRRYDADAVALNPLVAKGSEGENRWTGHRPKRVRLDAHRSVWHSQWIDCHLIAEKSFARALEYKIRPIDPARWAANQKLSSGVGRQMSIRLSRMCCGASNMYQVHESLVSHGGVPSEMNPEAREDRPLEA